jgi:diguanylate cyclase (GGDEF)-like protein
MSGYLPPSKSHWERRSPLVCLSERNALVSVPPMALNDELTRLYNREGFICAAECLRAGARSHERWTCLLTLQVDHLDVIEGALGSETADRFLILAGVCLREAFQRSAVIGRISSARFAVLFLLGGPAARSVSLNRLIETIDRHNTRRREIDLSLRGGFSQFETRSSFSVDHLLNDAEGRLQAAMGTVGGAADDQGNSSRGSSR